MSNNESMDKRRGGSALLIIILILGLSLLFFVFLSGKMDIHVHNKVSTSLENGISINQNESPADTAPQVNPRHVSAVYVIKDNKLSSCFIQIINAFEKNIFYIEVPLNAKLEISSELYKELLTYAPTLPQFVKLSRVSSYFSENYRYEGCTKILSENIGVKVTDWAAMSEADFTEFKTKASSEIADDYFSIYEKYANVYRNSLSTKARWAYYEIYKKSANIDKGTIPGQWDKTDFYITVVRARELIEELKY